MRKASIEAGNVPLGQAQHVVPSRTLDEIGDFKPARLAVVFGTMIASDGVLDHLLSSARREDLRRVGEVANNGDAGDRSRSRRAERAGCADRGGGRATEQEGRHFGGRVG